MFTCSYDGSVRMLDPAAGSFQLVLSDEEAEFSAFDCTADGATAFLGDKDGNIEVLDVRAGKTVQEGVNLHPKKINTVHVSQPRCRLACTAAFPTPSGYLGSFWPWSACCRSCMQHRHS